ncbi:hypothetical protein BDV28DRAFT_65777 [Aspergillus coremiiformis]|uniref:Uncharacterized protein n=1 Tax=Aspergillus coremiiformis TaxID=138285 RepID=A0A5N6ZGL1_9EURO|nr:hypothetical protein BDV28DRAFT_65777 [Aspergillus coremiiformis]
MLEKVLSIGSSLTVGTQWNESSPLLQIRPFSSCFTTYRWGRIVKVQSASSIGYQGQSIYTDRNATVKAMVYVFGAESLPIRPLSMLYTLDPQGLIGMKGSTTTTTTTTTTTWPLPVG